MKLPLFSTVAALVIAAFAPGRAAAVTTDGSALSLVIPVVASTSSYSSRIHVFNTDSFAVTVAVGYYGSPGTASPGYRSCGQILILGTTADYDIAALCGLGSGSHFGMLRLNANGFVSAYSRVSNPQGNGFSVEGIPNGNFFGSQLNVVGTKKSAVAPGYQTNCFVGSLDEPANYSIKLFAPNGSQIGSELTGSVGANELKRILDIFGAAGIESSELSDIRVQTSSTDANLPALVAFCTVQNNTSFDADFRIAKSRTGGGAGSNKVVRGLTPLAPFAGPAKHRFATVLKAPDQVGCWITAPQADKLEIRLIAPDRSVAGGGSDQASFVTFFGPRSTIAGGYDEVWTVEISPREIDQTYPLAYDFNCYAGNGMVRPVQIADGVDDF
jgi:hypothetical protein